jgi:hypothetical protein
MKEVQRPAPVLVTELHHDFDGVTNAAVGLNSCISQIIESAQHVVVPKRREREAQPAFVEERRLGGRFGDKKAVPRSSSRRFCQTTIYI